MKQGLLARCVSAIKAHVVNAALAVAMVVGVTGVASATDPTSCTSLSATPTLPLAVQCLSDTVAIGSFAVTVLTLFVPLLAMIWGLKGGFGIIKRLVGSMFGSIRRGA